MTMNLLTSMSLAFGIFGNFGAYALECEDVFRQNKLDFSHVQKGYDPELNSVKPGQSHTIENMSVYLADNLGESSIAAIRSNEKFLIIEGDGLEVREALKNNEWVIQEKVEKKVGFHEVVRIAKGDQKYVAIIRVNGSDRVFHMQSLLKLAGANSDQVFTLRHFRSWRPEYVTAFKKLQHEPDLVVFGLLPHVEGTFMDTNSPWIRPYHYLKRNYEDIDTYHDIGGRPFKVLTLVDGRKVWLLPPLYGDLIQDMLHSLKEVGAKRIEILGTAGAVNPKFKIGDWVTPKAVSKNVGHCRSSLPVNYESVRTPNLETQSWLNQQSQKGTDIIEVEMGYVTEFARQNPEIQVNIDLIVSDVLQGPNKVDLHQTAKVSVIPDLHEGVRRVLKENLGDDFRLHKVEDIFFQSADQQILAGLAGTPANVELGQLASAVKMKMLNTGTYQKSPVFSGQLGHGYYSADVSLADKKWQGFKSTQIGNPLAYHVSENGYELSHRVEVVKNDLARLNEILDLAYEKGAGEVQLQKSAQTGEIINLDVKFALSEDLQRFKKKLQLQDSPSLTRQLRSPDLQTKRRAARELVMSKAVYQQRFRLNRAKLTSIVSEVDPLFKISQKIMNQLNDPDAVARFVDEILLKASMKSVSPTAEEYKGAIAQVLSEYEWLPITTMPRAGLSSKAFKDVLAKGQPFLDENFLNRTHGSWTHVFQLAFVSKLLTAEYGPKGGEIFLKKLGELKGIKLWSFLFDSVNDIPCNYGNPEILNQMLWRVFEIN